MNTMRLILCLGAASCLNLAFADIPSSTTTDANTGPVKVEYVEPEKFTDVRERWSKTNPVKNSHLLSWKSYVEKQAAKALKNGQSLNIQFIDIDLAGDIEPSTRSNMMDVRVIKDLYPPRLKFTYQLKDSQGNTIKTGEENIRDIGFLMGSQINTTDTLRHEKKLFERWLKEAIKSE